MLAMSDPSREGQAGTAALFAAADDAAAGTVVDDLIAEPDLIEALAWPFQIGAAMRGAAPAANPNMRASHGGNGRQGVIIVMVALTFAWGLVGALLFLASLPFHPGT
jgi:hypothetical protein